MFQNGVPSLRALTPWSCGALLVINSLGRTLCQTPLVRILELTICRTYYLARDPALVGPDGNVEERLCKIIPIQDELANLMGWNTFSYAVVGLLTAFPYAYLGERLDRRLIIMVKLFSWAMAMSYVMCVCYFYETFNVKMIWAGSLFLVFGGSESILESLVNAMIAESVPASALSKTFYLISGTKHFSHVIGQSTGARLMESNLWHPLLLGFFIYTLSVPLLLLVREPRNLHTSAYRFTRLSTHLPPTPPSPSSSTSSEDSALLDPFLRPPTKTPFLTRLNTAILGSLTIFTDLIRDRMATICLTIFLLNLLAHGVEGLLQQWMSMGFGWSLAQANYILSFERVVGIVVLLALPVIVQVLQRRGTNPLLIDLRVVYFSLFTTLAGVLGLGMARDKTTVVLALAVYTMGFGFHDALKSYVTGVSPKEYITRLYIGITVAEGVGELIGGPMWAWVFSVGLRWGGRGFAVPFWVAGGFFTVAGGLVGALLVG